MSEMNSGWIFASFDEARGIPAAEGMRGGIGLVRDLHSPTISCDTNINSKLLGISCAIGFVGKKGVVDKLWISASEDAPGDPDDA